MNGSSGRKLYDEWIAPLDIDRGDYFVTDCLDTAMMSTGVEKRVTAAGGKDATYHLLVDELGLPPVEMPRHPPENQIVTQARENHERLRRQLTASGATTLITLGNAAARVVAEMGKQPGGQLDARTYHDERSVTIDGRPYVWHALVHPAVRPPWTETHRSWRESRQRS
jgi:hypothetical protein